jgi:aryl-alcohol dehydrogenase-like predicted oxidoreductase
LGKEGLVSSSLGLGCRSLAGTYGAADRGASLDLLGRALDAGITLFDIANTRHVEETERLVGAAVAPYREKVAIAAGTPCRPGGDPSRPVDLRRSCEASLARFGIDCLDLYYLDHADARVPIEDHVGQLVELADAGKILHIGLRGVSAEQLRRAHAVHPVTVLAVDYSLWRRNAEREHIPAARELGVGLVARRPLGGGVLTGRILSPDQIARDDARRGLPRLSPESLAAGFPSLRAAQEVAASMDVGLARLALAWLLAQGADVVPIPSTGSQIHLEMNLASADVHLEPEISALLSALFPIREHPPPPEE